MQVFTDIYKDNLWRDSESVSGHGSTLDATTEVRRVLPLIIQQQQIKSMLDIPCGDFNWIRKVNFPKDFVYIGADIVAELVESRQDRMRGRGYHAEARVLDISKDKLPKVDLVLVRDLFGHFSNADVQKALKNVQASGSTYLLATTFPLRENLGDIETGQWRPLNLQRYFGLPAPIDLFNENCKEGGGMFADKNLGLWKIN